MDKENSAATGSQAPGKQIPYSLKSTKKRSRQWFKRKIVKLMSAMNSLPQSCKRTSKSPNKGKAKKAKPSEGSYCLEQLLLCDAHLEVDVKDLNEDNVVDTAPGTEEEDSIPQAPVEDPCNIDMIDNEQESPDESPLAVDAGGHTSSSTKDTQPKNVPRQLLLMSNITPLDCS
ncbi:hypothetical protein TNCV_1280111 [Trichonephila clavipes]|nr:hypothetical protein TNCV_1280111 [Trichonephila clavipes]